MTEKMASIYSRIGAVIVFLLSCLVTCPSFVSSSIQFTSGMNSGFIQSVRRLELFISRHESLTNNPASDDEKLEFANSLLETGSDGLVYALHNLHEGIVTRGGTSSRSALEVYYNGRQQAGSADYMKETVQFADDLLRLQTSGYTVGIWACNIKNNFSCLTHLSNELQHRLRAQELFLRSKRVYAFSSPHVQSFNWCGCGSCKPLLGDFDGNRRADILCYNGDGSSRLTTFDETSGNFFNRNTRWYQAGERCGSGNVYVGRFNRDSRSDILCLKPRDRQKMSMVYSTSGGYLASSRGWQGNHEVVTRCLSDRSSAVYTGDFNGDGKTDVMCQNHATGDMRITYKPTDPVLFTWRWVVPWCRTATTQLFVGDFNGDRRDDLLCQDWRTGGSSIKMASYRGTFTGDVRWEGLHNFCRQNSGGTLFVGDFNGDRRSDLLCYSHRSGSRDTLKIAYANRSGHFENSQIVMMNFDWCSSPGARLRNVSDVNGDGRADLVCYDHNRRLSVALNDEYLYFRQ